MTTASDNFNRANATPIAAPWAVFIAGARIVSNRLEGGAGDEISYYNSGTWGDDQECTGTVGGLTSGSNYARLCLRLSGSGNGFGIYTDGASGSGHTAFESFTSGVPSDIAAIATTFVDGDVMRLTVSGASPNIVLTVYKNGAQVGQATGVSGANSGNPGAGAYGAGAIDDWSATDNAGGGVPALEESSWSSVMDPPTDNVFVSLWRAFLQSMRGPAAA